MATWPVGMRRASVISEVDGVDEHALDEDLVGGEVGDRDLGEDRARRR